MSLPRYPKYRDSGSAWLGEVPSHWNVQPCRAFVVEKTGKNEGAVNQNYLSLMANIGVIPYEEKGDVGNKKPDDLSKCKLVFEGDLVINSMNYGIGSYGLSRLNGVCSPVYIVLRPSLNRVRARFAFRIFENRAFQTYAQSFGNGILEHRAAINWDILKGIPVGLPPIEEQEAILTFLDCETAKIDALISEQEKLITLLAEKRQATIAHTVTKGLNPNAPMKESGVEWLGDMPEHWDVSPIRYIAHVGNGSTPNRDEPKYWNEGRYPWLNSSVVNQDKVTEANQFVTELALRECHLPIVVPPAVLVGITGQGRTRGMAATLLFEATINQHVVYIKPRSDSRLSVDFLRRVCDMAYQYLRSESDSAGSTKGAITCDQVLRLTIPLPGIDEQALIVSFLDDETARLDALTNEASRGIALLLERRSALISAAVTGKIDVRQAVQQEQITIQEAA
jgi:type I restriction enzyme S subunit